MFMGTVRVGLAVEKLRGLSGLLEAASSCNDKVSEQQAAFSFLASEISDIADEIEYAGNQNGGESQQKGT